MGNRNNVLPNIRPASDLRTKFTQVMNEIYQSGCPVFLTRKGRCDTVIMTADAFAKYELTADALYERYREALLKHNEGNKSDIQCSFCGDSQDKFEKLIVGPGVSICTKCVRLCVEILNEEND
jgi:prevent-host-death family protein